MPQPHLRPPRDQDHQAEQNGGGNLGFECTLKQAADKLRNNMNAAEYKHVVLGPIFLKYISDAFAERHTQLVAQEDDRADPGRVPAERVFCGVSTPLDTPFRRVGSR